MTRLQYDEIDREIRAALRKGMLEYQRGADTRRSEILRDRGIMLNIQNQNLKKIRKKSKKPH